MGQYDFQSLYGQADSSIFVYPAGEPDAVVEAASWGRTKDGTKGQWDVRFRTTTGPDAGRAQVKSTITISADNPQALGIMFRHLAALGIPVPDPNNPQQPPFWALGWSEEQVAQAMVGRPVQLKLAIDEWEGVQRNKVRDIRPPRPGAPTTWPQFQQPQQPPMPQYGQPQGYGMPQQPQYQDYPTIAPAAPFPPQPQYPGQPAFQAPQPQYPGAPAPYGGPAQPSAPAAPAAPWQQPQGAPAVNGAQPGPNPAVPPWAQPPTPGAGGVGEFTPQGQSQQPSVMQPQFQAPQPQGYAPAPAPQYAQPQYPGAPAPQPPQQGVPAPDASAWNGQQPGQAPQQAAGPQGAPPPPWAQ